MRPEFSLLTVLASMCATACFMIALMHLVLGFRGIHRRAYLLSSVMATAAAGIAVAELALTQSTDIPSYGATLKILHTLIFVMLMSLIWYVRLQLGGGSRWLMAAIAALWVVTLVVNFLSPIGVTYAEISELVSVRTPWGETYSVAAGATDPWKYLSDIASVLIVVFLAQATWAGWRAGQRQRAVLVGGSSLFFILLAGVLVPIQDAGILRTPLIISFAFLAIVAALGYQLVDEALKANDAAREVERLSRVITLGEMVGGLAHEINQPLSAILSNAQAARRFLATDDLDLDEIRDILDDIIADDKRASGIIRGLRRMLVREDAETLVVDVNDAIRFSAGLLHGELHARDVNIAMDLQPDLKAARAEPLQVQQVLLNVLLNAVRAVVDMPRKNRQVEVRSTERDGMVNVSVSDRGPGISEDLLPRLFDPFVSRSRDGLGIGLLICKRIVERHGGTIWAENRQSGGAVFRFTLPLAKAGGPA